ncbi:MAG: filamentous hemagglutinin N-terminal domain-containing protein, partial [Burkholderiaceae bacterium]|nr:filamentous hemagglutinin N-terminal domain-containing protein [Burkholderiaceae bacterium]
MNRVHKVVFNAALGVWQAASELVKSRGKSGRVRSALRRAALALALAASSGAGSAYAQAAPALPTGGVVKAGAASISAPAANALSINQSSNAAIINWQNFSIGQGASVNFNNGAGATLNRVQTGAPLSSIDGKLSATGSVYLVNPSGVIIGKEGVVNVGGGFVASTLDMDDKAFMKGGARTLSGASDAAVVNLGKVGALGGDVVLAAATVRNEGQISAPKGSVGLLAGNKIVMKDLADQNGKFTVELGGAGTSVTNKGSIEATAAELRANGGNVYALAGNTASIVKATEVTQQGGQIFLTAPGGKVDVQAGVTLDASGAGTGDGGHILVDSAQTGFQGTALAKGGAKGGNGGLVETSGTKLDIAGAKVDASAAQGKAGTWLLDPDDITVDATTATSIETSLNSSTSVVLQTTASGTGGVGDITIAAPISWTTSASTKLELDAYHSVHVNAPITVKGNGEVVINANGATTTDSALDFGLTSTGFTGSLNFLNSSGALAEGNGSLSINGTTYKLLYSMDDLQGINSTNLNGNYALAGNLTAPHTAYGQAVVGFEDGAAFTGVFEGLGHTIANLNIDSYMRYSGLFGLVKDGTIRDIGLVGGQVRGDTSAGNGALIGEMEDSTVSNVYATSTVSGDSATFVGGLVGYQKGGTLSNAYATGSVSGFMAVGGLVGDKISGTLTNAYATGTVSGGFLIGGLVGALTGDLSNAYATGVVIGSNSIGGWVGQQSTGTISNTYATGAVISSGAHVGGLVG